MPAACVFQDDAGLTISTKSFGAIIDGSSVQKKLYVFNAGESVASGLKISTERYVTSDGVEFVQIAEDTGGNPDTFSSILYLGDLQAGERVPFWVKIQVPVGTTPAGNPRGFELNLEYQGT